MKTLDQLQRYSPVSEWDGEHATKKDPQGEYVKLFDLEEMLKEQEEPYAWAINYTPGNVQCTRFHGHNAIADYRSIDPNATSTPLYVRSKSNES